MNLKETIIKIHNESAVGSRVSLSGGLSEGCGERGEKTNTVCNIFERLRYNGSKFGADYITADGGIRDFAVIYEMGKYEIIVRHFSYEFPFNNIDELIMWIEKEERKIKATMLLEIEDES